MIYDAAIIGTGPAGLSAALNLKIHNKNIIWLGSKNGSDKVEKAEEIRNYPGFPFATGAELNAAFQKHAEAMELTVTEQMVNSILPFDGHYALMAGPEFYEAKTVILATGVAMKGTLPGEAEFLGAGVSYCATCDGGLYRKKVIAVVSNNARFEHEVKYLAEIADTVHFFARYKDPSAIGENVILHAEKPEEVIAEGGRVAAIRTASESIPVNGVFFLRDSIALDALLSTLAVENGHIAVNRAMETNLPGVYACGDCTGRPYQYTKAVGEGNVAAHSVLEYLK